MKIPQVPYLRSGVCSSPSLHETSGGDGGYRNPLLHETNGGGGENGCRSLSLLENGGGGGGGGDSRSSWLLGREGHRSSSLLKTNVVVAVADSDCHG